MDCDGKSHSSVGDEDGEGAHGDGRKSSCFSTVWLGLFSSKRLLGSESLGRGWLMYVCLGLFFLGCITLRSSLFGIGLSSSVSGLGLLVSFLWLRLVKISLSLGLSLLVSLAVIGRWNTLFVISLAHEAVRLIHEPRITNASLVVIAVIDGVCSGEGHEVARVRFDTLSEVLGVRSSTLFRERSHFGATQMVLGVQVEEVKEIKVDLSSMVSRVRLSSEFDIALFVAIEDVGSGAEGGEDLAKFVVLVRFVESSGDLVHGWHRATRSHVDPEGRKESKDAALEVFWVHHDVHLVLGVARVDGISEATVVIVPFHHEGTTGVVLSVLIRRPGLGGPSVRVEVALRRAIEGRIFGVLSAMMILDVFETLSEVFMMIGLGAVCLEDNMGEQSGEFTLASLSFSKTKTLVTFTTELGEKSSSNSKGFVGVKLVVKGEEMLEILLTKDLHDHSDVLFVFVLNIRARLESS